MGVGGGVGGVGVCGGGGGAHDKVSATHARRPPPTPPPPPHPHTHSPPEEALERDYFLSADQALEWGLVDEVITHRPPPQEEGDY